jgi:hypothetical protein
VRGNVDVSDLLDDDTRDALLAHAEHLIAELVVRQRQTIRSPMSSSHEGELLIREETVFSPL